MPDETTIDALRAALGANEAAVRDLATNAAEVIPVGIESADGNRVENRRPPR